MSDQMEEILDFVKFDPEPKGGVDYPDFPQFFKLLNPQYEQVIAQGHGNGSKYPPLNFSLNMGISDAKTLLDMCRHNQKTKLKGVHYCSTKVYDEDRKKRVDIKYEVLTIRNAGMGPASGDDDVNVTLVIDWQKAEGKMTQFKLDGSIHKASPVKIDLTKGKYK